MPQYHQMKSLAPIIASVFLLSACADSSASNEAPANKKAQTTTELTPVQRGAKIYKRCRSCHTVEEGGRNKVGPNLWGLYGSKTASKEGYAYSKAMRAADITWDETTLDAYLKKPSKFIPGTKMTFIGLKKQEDRYAVQAYLKEKTSP